MSGPDQVNGYRVHLQTAYDVWDAAFGPYGGHDRFSLEPDVVIQRYNATHRRKLVRNDLENWTAFENCQVDWDYHDFERMVLADIDMGADILLITDEGIMEGCAFRFCRAQFEDFAVWYEREYEMGFFQSADYIVFDQDVKVLRVLHHDGVLFVAPSTECTP